VGLSAWFVGLPLAAWVGVRAWPLIGLMAMMNAATIGYIVLLMRWRTRRTRHVIVLNLLLATILAMSSCWLGPFVLVPVACCSIALIFASRCKPSERPWVMGIWSVAILAPFALELTHVLPPSFSFVGGEVILHPRALRLPEGPTLVALAYTSLTFMLFPVIFVGRLRDRQRDGDRRLFVQAWALTQLFPGAGREDVRVRGGVGAKDE
jgi:serine/threonine-protein kinase